MNIIKKWIYALLGIDKKTEELYRKIAELEGRLTPVAVDDHNGEDHDAPPEKWDTLSERDMEDPQDAFPSEETQKKWKEHLLGLPMEDTIMDASRDTPAETTSTPMEAYNNCKPVSKRTRAYLELRMIAALKNMARNIQPDNDVRYCAGHLDMYLEREGLRKEDKNIMIRYGLIVRKDGAYQITERGYALITPLRQESQCPQDSGEDYANSGTGDPSDTISGKPKPDNPQVCDIEATPECAGEENNVIDTQLRDELCPIDVTSIPYARKTSVLRWLIIQHAAAIMRAHDDWSLDKCIHEAMMAAKQAGITNVNIGIAFSYFLRAGSPDVVKSAMICKGGVDIAFPNIKALVLGMLGDIVRKRDYRRIIEIIDIDKYDNGSTMDRLKKAGLYRRIGRGVWKKKHSYLHEYMPDREKSLNILSIVYGKDKEAKEIEKLLQNL